MSLRDTILGAKDRPSEKLVVPEWDNAEVYVRVLSGGERDRFESAVNDGTSVKTDDIRARLACMALVDADGKRIFTDADTALVSEKSSIALDRIFSVAMRVNLMSSAAIEDAKKNSAIAPTTVSGSG